MKVFYVVLALIGLGLFAAVMLSTVMVVLIVAGVGWLTTFVPSFGGREKRQGT